MFIGGVYALGPVVAGQLLAVGLDRGRSDGGEEPQMSATGIAPPRISAVPLPVCCSTHSSAELGGE